MSPTAWKLEVMERVICLIGEANGGRWPQNIWQWRRVARRFGIKLKFLRVRGGLTACYQDGCLVIGWTEQPGYTLRWLVHEISEAILLWEGEPEYRHPVQFSETQDALRHQLACKVEKMLVVG